MKKMVLILVFVMVAISVFPVSSYAKGHGRAWGHHQRQLWRAHEREWREYDRLWIIHRGDRYWREKHIIMWREWYRWHRENDSFLDINISSGSHSGASFEIHLRN